MIEMGFGTMKSQPDNNAKKFRNYFNSNPILRQITKLGKLRKQVAFYLVLVLKINSKLP